MSDNIQATLTIQTKIAEDAKLSKFIQDFPGQWAAIDRAAKAAGVTIDQVQQSLATLGTKKNFLQMAAEGATFTRGEWTQLNSVIKKLAYDQLKIQADAALAAQKTTKETKAQTDATKQLAQQTTNLGNAQKQAAAKKGKTGQGLLVAQEQGINQVGRQLGQLEINSQAALAKQSQTILKGTIDSSVAMTKEGAQHRLKAHTDENNQKLITYYKDLNVQKDALQQARALGREARAEERRDAAKADAVANRARRGTLDLQKKVNEAILGQGKAAERAALMTQQGMTRTQAYMQQLMSAGFNQQNAGFLAGGGAMPPGFPKAGGAGGGGIWQKILGMLGFGGGGGAAAGIVRNLAGGLGVGAGFYGVKQLGEGAVEAAKAATAYDRMEVSARKLAGSQAELNSLLSAYQDAAGGAVSQAVALENVVRLQATGFANTADEVERFVRGARGAALSLGKPQDFVVQETQLAVSNTSVKRLDQIGLGIQEVNDRTKQLRDTNKGWTREMAFQEAVIGLLNEKYGSLSDTIEGQATGVEKLSATFSDIYLVAGQVVQGPLYAFANALDSIIDKATQVYLTISKWGDGVPDWVMHVFGQNPEVFREAASPGVILPPSQRGGFTAPRRAAADPFEDQREAMAVDRARRLEQIDKDAHQAERDERRSHIQAVTDLNNQYYKTLARDNEDYQRDRAKSEANYARQVAELHEDAQEREIEAAKDLMNQIVRMNRDAAREEARAQRDLNRSIEDMYEDHAKQVEDARKDHGKRIEDLEEDYNRSIEDAREDSTKRLQEMQTEYDERVVEEREDSTKRLAEMEADYAKDRVRSQQQYQLSNLEAIANLDAKSLWLNQQRYALETKQAQEAHQEAIDEEKKRLAEFEAEASKDHQKAIEKEKKRLQEFEDEAAESHKRRLKEEQESFKEREEEEEKALSERINDAKESFELQRKDAQDALKLQQDDLIQAHADQKRENDAADHQRLLDMQAAHLLEQGEAEADRLFRLGRMEVDHQAQLTEMGKQHTARITQIGTHAQEERDKMETEHKEALLDLGVYIEGWSLQHARLVQHAVEGFNDWLLGIEEAFGEGGLSPEDQARVAQLESDRDYWQSIANDESKSQSERNSAQSTANELQLQINDIKAGRTAGVSQVYSSSIQTGGKLVTNTGTTGGIVGGGTSVVIQQGAVQITAYPGQSVPALGDEFEKRLLSVVKNLSRMGP